MAANRPAAMPCQSRASLIDGPKTTTAANSASSNASRPSMKGSAGRPAFRVSAMRRGRCRRCQERDDRQQLAGDAEIVRHELGAGNDETTGDLRDKQAEQAEIGV